MAAGLDFPFKRWMSLSSTTPGTGSETVELDEIQRILNAHGDLETGGRGRDELNEMRNRLSSELDAMTTLQQVGSLCASPGADLLTCLGKLVEAALTLLGGSKGNIQLFDETSGTLKIAAHRGLGQEFLDHFESVGYEASTCGAAMRRRQRILVEDVSVSPVFAGTTSLEVLRREGIRAVQSTPLTSSTGRLLGMISTHYQTPRPFSDSELRRIDILARQAADFVERKRSEQALSELARKRQSLLEAEQAARKEAERACRLKDDFLATLSHELRTPVQAVLGWAQILQRRQEPEDLREGLEIIERNCRTQAQLLSDLLDTSRIISGQLRLEVQPTDLHEILDEAIQTVRPAAEARQIRIVKRFGPFRGAPTLGDSRRLQQVFWNLLNNAIKFTPPGGSIRVSLERHESRIELTFQDSGQGIAPEFLPHLFERFRQGDSSASRKPGLGLGLAIVRSIVEAHGGSVVARSDGEGKGAAFIISLPLFLQHRDSREETAGSSTPRESSAVAVDVDLHGVRVLVVDDEPDARALISRVLEDAGAEVATAANAEEALARLDREVPDVLISDLGMPEKNGFDLIRAVRSSSERCSRVPAIALTAFARTEDRARAMLFGYQVHLSKPVEAAELCSAVARLSADPSPQPDRVLLSRRHLRIEP